MPSISPISNGSNQTSIVEPGSARVPQKELGKNDFMKLLAVQFQMQDPMKPMEDTAFIAQTAQFSSLEQATTMAHDLAAMRAEQQRVTANSYLGHRVTIDLGEGETATGDVTAIDNSGTAPRLVVGEESFPLSAVLRVEPGLVSIPRSAGA